MKPSFGAVIAAAGSSTRMGTGRSKVLESLGGKPVLLWSLEALAASGTVGETVVVCREEDRKAVEEIALPFGGSVHSALGGEDRQESVSRGAEALRGDWEYLLIHDGARPFLSPELVRQVCRDAERCGAAAAALPVKDTVKRGEGGFVVETPAREGLFAAQTPQAFRRELYLSALALARREGRSYTDDCQLIEAAGGSVFLTAGEERNRKLTTPYDLETARLELGRERAEMRIGHGYDVHRLVSGRKLILGGVEIPFSQGLLGHSDADVLSHALCDAILGAAALGDIGHLFPDSDPRYQGADSVKLLTQVCAVAREAGFQLVNADCTLLAQRPKIAPYVEEMRRNLAAACGVDVGRISVKATTEEGLGFTGAGEGMAAHAVALLDGQSRA